ncbi:prolyl aminopeptidase [Neptunicoccus cionae]|uniref:prolyl aminopeptidase n=1 Tax=Neptunicoccus cionae TaxID=2035344 RepID=UPI000C778A59|nr:prolyl aminopeptidase [Amylibacter cionae]PLS22815.1 prolyl aminopeptidase [Amylibacter cionae]
MRNSESQIGASRNLYPVIQPFNQMMLEVPGDHTLYVEECGNPNGIPVVVFHGGPGGGCSPGMRRFFHPEFYRIILFDQRGCGRSRPHASVENNTTWDLVADIELIRQKLGIENWIVFGGSWGATLALVYAQTHPDRVNHLVLRGVFTMTNAELDWFYGGGAAAFFPDEWEHFAGLLPLNERDDVIGNYAKRLFSSNEDIQIRFARAWTEWESALAALEQSPNRGVVPAAYALAFARIENHYFHNAGFLREDGQIFKDLHKIEHIPGSIVQGRYDMICPPQTAYRLRDNWPAARLITVPDAGHSLSEPGITSALITIMDELS